VIVPVSFSLKRVDAPEEFSVDRVLADIVSTPDWKVDVEVAVYDTEAQRSYGGELSPRLDGDAVRVQGQLPAYLRLARVPARAARRGRPPAGGDVITIALVGVALIGYGLGRFQGWRHEIATLERMKVAIKRKTGESP
jgi:hypothetical protein